MSKFLNWATKAAAEVQQNVARDGLLHVAKRFWKNFGQLKFGTLVGEDEFGNKCALLAGALSSLFPPFPLISVSSFDTSE